ncbi:MAG: phytoene desaturase [Parvularculaceae bacterium]|nr:phytoene desaturase [Parvularculaceae bacterium]
MLTGLDRPKPDPTGKPHAIVIGSGFGGLAAAVRLGARGYHVTVLERLDAPGGRAYVFKQDGFTFDAGPTIITAPFLFDDLWRLCGRDIAQDVALKPVDPFYTIRFDDGSSFRYNGDPDAMRREVERFSPSDVPGYERFMEASRAICEVAFEKLGHAPFGDFVDMIRVVPDLVRLGGRLSVYDLVAKYIRDPRLRVVFSFHPLLIGGNPFSATAVYALIPYLERRWGVHCAIGGTGALVNGLAGLIRSQGGSVRCNAEVSEILVENGAANGVRLASGETIAADIVVSNADASTTLRSLLPPSAPRRWSGAKVEGARHSMSLFVWYFGTRKKFPDVGHHTIVLGPRYRGLLDDIFRRKVLADDFSLYLHRPTDADPSLAPAGCDAFYVLSPTPHLGSGVDWRTQAETYRKSIARRLSETVMPGFEDEIVTSRLMTPLDFQDRLGSYLGAAFSLEPTLLQSAWFRPHNRSADIRNFYLVGAGTHPGAGLPGVLSSARVLDSVVPHADALAAK